jgi:D-glycero-alpha-D-manno-heptose-7-phosphate kinase
MATKPSSPFRHKVRSRAPLRLGLAGGGTDLSLYCDDHGGAVLNITLHRFAYAFVSPTADGTVQLTSHDYAVSESCDPAGGVAAITGSNATRLHRGVYLRMMRQFNNGQLVPLSIATSADSPPGSGLGTSSAIVVALVDAFRELLDLPLGRYDVARLAYEIERQDLDLAGGQQDHYAAAFGGVNFIEFLPQDRVVVNPLRLAAGHLDELEASMVTCFSGMSRSSGQIIDDQSARLKAADADAIAGMHKLKADALAMKGALLQGDIPGIAAILEQSWQAKKRTSRIVSNAQIERIFELALTNGAMAGKVSGAGGGGFMMFVTSPEARQGLLGTLRDAGLVAEAVRFVDKGCETWTRPL